MSKKVVKKQKNYKIHIIVYSVLSVLLLINITLTVINKEALSAFKRLYTNYSKTLQMTVNKMEEDTGCYFSTSKDIPNDFSGCDNFFKEFARNLRVTKYCKNNSLKEGCLPLYKNYIETPDCEGFSKNMMNNVNPTYVIGETSTITIYNLEENYPLPIIAIDSNGKFIPNKSGYDRFSLIIMKSPNGNFYFHPNVTYCLPLEKGGVRKLQDIYK